MKIFIIGVNGFIGNALTRRILADTSWRVMGIDVEKDRLNEELLNDPRFTFYHGDIGINREWVEFQIKRSDVVFPLAAVAVPKIYIQNPLLVFELDFMENLRIIELCVKYNKRLIFPSTSEVYGMANDQVFEEDNTNFILGPINKHRWIYSCAKQLLDRVIHAQGLQKGLQYTIFRPFNWVGPGLDRIEEQKIGNSRVVTQFIADIVFNRPIQLVAGGQQRRCFTYLEDGIDGLLAILSSPEKAQGEIVNIGNPNNDLSIQQLAEKLIQLYKEHPMSKEYPFTSGINNVTDEKYYGSGYQDVTSRKPSVHKARELFGWEPKVNVEETLRNTLNWFCNQRTTWEKI
jgi:nucleoside-diphosphate-sugar epimerase